MRSTPNPQSTITNQQRFNNPRSSNQRSSDLRRLERRDYSVRRAIVVTQELPELLSGQNGLSTRASANHAHCFAYVVYVLLEYERGTDDLRPSSTIPPRLGAEHASRFLTKAIEENRRTFHSILLNTRADRVAACVMQRGALDKRFRGRVHTRGSLATALQPAPTPTAPLRCASLIRCASFMRCASYMRCASFKRVTGF